MTLTEYPELEQGSEEWLTARLGIVTASVVGRLITPKTIKPCDNPDSRAVTAQLVAERITGWSDPTYVNADMQRGNDCEPIARDLYSRDHATATELGFMVRQFDSGTRLGFSPDGLVGDDGLIEIKAPRAKAHLLTVLSDEVPIHHLPQIQAGLLVSDREWCDFVSFYGGMGLFVKRVHRDERWTDAITEAVEGFEIAATEMVADYGHKSQALAPTERIIELEMSI